MELYFPNGIPGFENIHRYRLQELADQFAVMEAQDGSGVRFFLLKVKGIPELEARYAHLRSKNGVKNGQELYCILIFRKKDGKVMVNLQAPLLIDSEKQSGEQVVIDDPSLARDYVLMQATC